MHLIFFLRSRYAQISAHYDFDLKIFLEKLGASLSDIFRYMYVYVTKVIIHFQMMKRENATQLHVR